MSVILKNVTGSGSTADKVPFSYSYAEDVTTLQPESLDGGAGQVTASAIAVAENKVGNTHPNSRLLINNTMELTHSDGGSVKFQVSQVSTNEGVVSITGETIASRLNVEVTAAPHGNSGYTLLSAIEAYCLLAGVSVAEGNLAFEGTLADELDLVPVNFIGWKGNLWEHLKMLCAAASASVSAEVPFEVYTDGDVLTFRHAKTTYASYSGKNLSSQSVSINTFDAAKELNIYNYTTAWKSDHVVHDQSSRASGQYASYNSTLPDGIQVNAGETVVRRVQIDASLINVNKPTAVDAILPLPYTSGSGQYCIAGSDGILLKSSQWTAQGGNLTVALTENPNEIEITVTAPPAPSLEQTSSTALGYAPYRVGVEIADGVEYPALYITGDGVFFSKELYTIATGASDEYTSKTSAPTIDNPFITSLERMYTRGTAAAQVLCGPSVTLSETVAGALPFGSTPGKLRLVDNNEYRITNVSYSADQTEITAQAVVSFEKFDDKWDGKTFANFTSVALDVADFPDDALKFNEFTVIPLMETA